MESLAGTWVLKRKGSDYIPGVESIFGVPFTTQIINDQQLIHIKSGHIPNEEINLTFQDAGRLTEIVFQIGRLNFEHVSSGGVILGIVVQIDPDFRECSLLRIGPSKGQKSLEQYKLSDNGDEIRVEIDHVLPDRDTLKLVKILSRLKSGSDDNNPGFDYARYANSWVHPHNHAANTLKSIRIKFTETIDIGSNGYGWDNARISKYNGRKFNGQAAGAESFQLFVIEVSFGRKTWEVMYRYREFDAIRQFLTNELGDMVKSTVPHFPSKTIGKLKGKSLDKRKDELSAYLSYFLEVGGYNITNVVDVLSSFFEVPEHADEIVTAIPQAQSALRRQLLVASPLMEEDQEQLVPTHVVTSMLTTGVRILKHCRYSDPHYKVLRCKPNDPSIIFICDDWGQHVDPSFIAPIPNDAVALRIYNIQEIRRGTEKDPSAKGYCGTKTLRGSCEPFRFAYCFSLITAERSYDFQTANREEFNKLYPNLLNYFRSMKNDKS